MLVLALVAAIMLRLYSLPQSVLAIMHLISIQF